MAELEHPGGDMTGRWRRDVEVRDRRRELFDAVADDYDRVRPKYPAEVFAALCELADLSAGARILEVGCGTGQATVPLARLGFSIVAVELGEELAAIARQRVAAFPSVEVVTSGFEDWKPSEGAFDAVVSFAAIHWVDPEVRFVKAARLLRPGGALAVFDWQDTLSVDGDDFFLDVQEDYAAVVPGWRAVPPEPSAVKADWLRVDIDATAGFGLVQERRFVWTVTYSADDYVAFLTTRSSYRDLEEPIRGDLLGRIHRRIEGRPQQTVNKEFVGILAVASRLAQ